MTNKIFKIVKIINEYKVVVNAGSRDSIQEGDTFAVFKTGQEVIDPETNESLGTLDFIKAKLRAVDVFPKMCICENRDGELDETLQAIMTPPFTKRLPLNVDSKDISGGFESVDKKIKVGDLVRKTD